MNRMLIKISFIIFSVVFSQDPPDEFEHEQSTAFASYSFNNVYINEINIDLDDWVGAFKGDICVGASQWDTLACSGGICTIDIWGDDGQPNSDGYMLTGDIPIFKIYDTSKNIYYDTEYHLSDDSDCGGEPCSEEVCEWEGTNSCHLDQLTAIIKYGCIDESACNYNEEANTDNGLCEYLEEYWEDSDGDGQGYYAEIEDIEEYCLEDVPEGWILYEGSTFDQWPNCFNIINDDGLAINPYDDCDECNGETFINDEGFFSDGTCDCEGTLPILYCENFDNDLSGNSNPDDWILLCYDDFVAMNLEVILFSAEGEGSPNCQDTDDNCTSNFHDECGECDGDNDCYDCAGVPDGNSWESDCGCVDGDNSGDECDDCEGVPNGDAVVDDCGVCDGGNAQQDCAGECNGPAIEDCFGICNGDAFFDDCCMCVEGTTGLEACNVSVSFPDLIDNDYKDYVVIPINLDGYVNSVGLEGFEFTFSYNNTYYTLDENETNLSDQLIQAGYSLNYIINDYSYNDTLNYVKIISYTADNFITNFDSSNIINLTFRLNSQNGDNFTYLHNQQTNLEFIEFYDGHSSNICLINNTNNGIVEFKTMMCLDGYASNYCDNNEGDCIYEDENNPGLPSPDYIIEEGLCEYTAEVTTDSDGVLLNDIVLTNSEGTILLIIESGVIIEDADGNPYEGEISLSQFFNNGILPDPISEADDPLLLWGDVIAVEPYELFFQYGDEGEIIFTIQFVPHRILSYDLYELQPDSNGGYGEWEQVDEAICDDEENENRCSATINSSGLYSIVLGGLGCIDDGLQGSDYNNNQGGTGSVIPEEAACNYNENAEVDDGTCTYSTDPEFPPWCADVDGDGYGDLSTFSYSCMQPDTETTWVYDCSDQEPLCATNNTDYCGECGGDNDCFEYPDNFIDSWILVEQNQYLNSDCYAATDEDVEIYTGPFSADFTDEECLLYQMQLNFTAPCQWIDSSCHEINNNCVDIDNNNQETCESNNYCLWQLDSCIEINNNCVDIDNEEDCIINENSNSAQFICVTHQLLVGTNWLFDEDLSEKYEWGVNNNQLCFNYNENIYECIDFIFRNDENEVRLQHKDNDNGECFEEIYQRPSYLSIDKEEFPKQFKLYKNFPNPFNPITNISFDIAVADFISLDIYNIRGQHIDKIVSGFFIPGQYNFKFNGKNLSSGIYFISLKSNTFNLSQKMVLLK